MAEKVFDHEPETSYRSILEFPAAKEFEWYFEQTPFLWPDEDDPAWVIRLWWHPIDGRFEVVGFEIHSTHRNNRGEWVIGELHGGPLNATLLRSVPLGALIEKGRHQMIEVLTELAARLEAEDLGGVTVDEAVLEKVGWKEFWPSPEAFRLVLDETQRDLTGMYSEEHWQNVANAYDQAWAASRHPTKDVAEKLNVSRSTAAKWVSICRKRGLLPPTEKTKPRGNPTTGGADGVGDED